MINLSNKAGTKDEIRKIYRIVSAEWSQNNVRVTGKNKGVTAIDFGSDASCSKNKLSVVVVCY